MAKLYYRGMAEENGKPKVGRSARLLGVRPGIDNVIREIRGCTGKYSKRLGKS
ncbi:hypothetical protein ACE1CD_19385 [Aerosakkonema sp. BLCC-F183]|uniref:hypothetical protein n=1 Tax=Aerosakkonema sp. BLCC-F183 TaxID=3342834 RepID=UPI0035BA1DCC